MMMVSCLVRNDIKLIMKNHFYSLDNFIIKQGKGGAIGNIVKERSCMNSRIAIPYKSAHSRKMMMAVLVKEGVKQMRKNSQRMDGELTRKLMAKWSRKLRRCGYP